jgi:hypothetical protein
VLTRSTAAATPQPVGVDPRLQRKVVALGERLPALWADPATRREHRKALLRCLIKKVVMRRIAWDQAEVRIVWRGRALTVNMPVNSLSALPRHAEMEQRVCELAAAGYYDDEIARMLTAEGHRSPWRGSEVLASTVRSIRIRHGEKVRQRTPVACGLRLASYNT